MKNALGLHILFFIWSLKTNVPSTAASGKWFKQINTCLDQIRSRGPPHTKLWSPILAIQYVEVSISSKDETAWILSCLSGKRREPPRPVPKVKLHDENTLTADITVDCPLVWWLPGLAWCWDPKVHYALRSRWNATERPLGVKPIPNDFLSRALVMVKDLRAKLERNHLMGMHEQ